MNNENQERQRIVDDYFIKQEFIKLEIAKHIGKEPTNKEINSFLKYLAMEYENNSSKNSLDNRIVSIGKTIIGKYDKYKRITSFSQN